MARFLNQNAGNDSYDNVPLTTHYPGARYENFDRSGDYSPSTISVNTAQKDEEPIVKIESKTSGLSPSTISHALTGLTARSSPERQWKTTFLRFGPLSGIFCMLLAMASIVAALGILAGSNGAAVSTWITPPSTYLAIFAAVANLSVRYSAVQGVVVAWWSRASRPEGATLEKLHYNWLAGSSFHRALMAGRHMGLIGLACIFSTIVVIDGPLLQRASTVVAAPWNGESIPLNVSMAQELPRYFGNCTAAPRNIVGNPYHWSYAFNNTIPTGDGGTASNNLYPVIPDDNKMLSTLSSLVRDDNALSGVIHGCPDTCTAKIRAPALTPTVCTSTMVPVNYSNIIYLKNRELGQSEAVPLEWEKFFISIGLVFDKKESLDLVTAYPVYNDLEFCAGHLNMTACTYESAIGEYTVQIANGKATLLDADDPHIIALANNSAIDLETDNGPIKRSSLAPIVTSAYSRFESIAAFLPTKSGHLEGITNGPGGPIVDEFQKPNTGTADQCPVFVDARPDVMKNINKIMVWAGSIAASQNANYATHLESQMDSNLPLHSQINGVRTGSHSVFHTDYAFFLAAALVEIVCIAFIAPTYWGWWKLGREMSFSPLEVAKAFRAPMLDEYHSNSRGRHIAKAGGDLSLRYGVVELDSNGDSKALAFADPAAVSDPEQGTHLAR